MKQVVHARLQRYWDIRAAGNFSFGGSGSGLVLAAAAGFLAGVPSALAVAAGLVLIGLGLFCVWLEIGRPWRAINVFFHPRTSWMTREALLVPPLMAAGAAAVLLDIRFVLVAAPFAAGFLYCQARMLYAARGIPAWCQKEAVPLILATGLAEGAGLFLVIAGAPPAMIAVALAAAVLREIAREFYRRGLVKAKAPAGTLAWFSLREEKLLTAVRYLAIVLLALALAGWNIWGAAALGGLLVLATGWGLKVMMITRAAFTRGHVIKQTPARGRDLSHVVTPS
jgi:phenylacetyl-CoA:acceptor oxidoreductase subunit 2